MNLEIWCPACGTRRDVIYTYGENSKRTDIPFDLCNNYSLIEMLSISILIESFLATYVVKRLWCLLFKFKLSVASVIRVCKIQFSLGKLYARYHNLVHSYFNRYHMLGVTIWTFITVCPEENVLTIIESVSNQTKQCGHILLDECRLIITTTSCK